MPPPVQKQSSYEGAHRPWSLREKSAKPHCRKPETEAQRRERETCLSCPEPECDPDYCHHRSEAKHGKRPPGIPEDFLIQMDLGTSLRNLAKRYGVTQRTISLWKRKVKEEPASAGTENGPTHKRTAASVSPGGPQVKKGSAMKEHFILITTDCMICVREVEGDLLGFLQKLCGGYVQTCHMKRLLPPHTLIVNEEGKLKGLPANVIASWLYGPSVDIIVGPAVLCKEGLRDGEPDIVGFTAEEASALVNDILARFLDKLEVLRHE